MFLKKNDVIGIIAPASFLKKEAALKLALDLLKDWGLQYKLAKNLFNKHNHFAGTDKERISDFQFFLDHKNIKAIWCVCGGYGSIRIIDKLNFTKFRSNPKWIIGYSDITVFHQAIHNLGFESIHSFMPTSIKTILENKIAIKNFKKILFGKTIKYELKPNQNNRLGKVKGKIIGGNLAIISSLLGTKYTLKERYILFIEEVGEYKYSIDRMLQSLKLNGYFINCKALVLGSFSEIKKNNPLFGQTIEEIVLNVVAAYNFPVCFDFPAGHLTNNNPIIFGREVTLNITDKNVTLGF
ncbi:MAG: LD-carboxypeptidase [Flavobacteriaceae bacterium]|nr:LD-carboxypeptidase [Flavobacteriaceae bacterium]